MKSLLRMASPAGQRAPLSVLIFHRVLPEQDPIFPAEMHARRFDEVCGWLKNWFHVLPLDTAVRSLESGTLPERAACITFDDGYADNHDVALPILQRHGLTATFFIATGFLDGGRMWNDTVIEAVRGARQPILDVGELGLFPLGSPAEQAAAIDALLRQIKYLPVAERLAVAGGVAHAADAALPDNLMMSSNQVKRMRAAGMGIGAHTSSHPILARLADDVARDEIRKSKEFLECLLRERIELFAYPNGKPGKDYTENSVSIVKTLGFDAAVSTQRGASRRGDDPFQIRRFTPWDQTWPLFGMRMLANLRVPLSTDVAT